MVIAGAFAIMGIYVVRGQVPDATVVAFLSLPLGAVIGFYFGHINGTATALSNSATSLSVVATNLAAHALASSSNRRTDDIGASPVVVQPVTATQ